MTKLENVVREEVDNVLLNSPFRSDANKVVDEMNYYADKMISLSQHIKDVSNRLYSVIKEIDQTIENIIGRKNCTVDHEIDDYEVEFAVRIKSYQQIFQYLKQHEQELSREFDEFGDYEGKSLDDLANSPEDIMQLLQVMFEDLENELARTHKVFDISITTYNSYISIEITTPVNMRKLAETGEIMDI